MSLNISKGDMYPWITHTWNTVKGECPHGCTYCYMKRWGKQKPVHFDKKEFKQFEMDAKKYGDGLFIFVGSSCDLFAGGIPTDWTLATMRHCARFNKNKYLFQSKNPSGFGWLHEQEFSELRKNTVLCTTIETNRWYPEIMKQSSHPSDRASAMSYLSSFQRYVTIEPIMDFDFSSMVELIKRCEPIQVNIGADSGNNHLPEPSADKILALIDELKKFTTIAKKSNLERLFKKYS